MRAISKLYDHQWEPLEKPPHWPIRDYCERVLARRFGGSRRVFAHCPFTSPEDGGGGKAFVIDEDHNNARCFGQCEKTWTPFDLHREVFQFPTWEAALTDFKKRLRETSSSDVTNLSPKIPTRRPSFTPVDESLVAYALSEYRGINAAAIRNLEEGDDAQEVGRRLVKCYGEERLAIAQSYKSVFIGRPAQRWLANERTAGRTQFLCCWGIREGHNRVTNETVDRPIMLDIEFDDNKADDQLRLIWALKNRWRTALFSICWSGGKSYHALFYVAKIKEGELELKKAQAASMGACKASMRPHQWVRFPGGWRTGPGPTGRQTLLYLDHVSLIGE
jgi:hypothetical protein